MIQSRKVIQGEGEGGDPETGKMTLDQTGSTLKNAMLDLGSTNREGVESNTRGEE